MNPFLAIDLTTNSANEKTNGEEFLVFKPSDSLTQILESSTENATDVAQKASLPLALKIVQWVCLIGAVVCITITMRALKNTSFDEAYQNFPYLFWITGICLIAWLAIKIIGATKQKKVLNTEETEMVLSRLDGVYDSIYSEMSVPADAKDVDVLSFYYKIKKDEIKLHEKPMQLFSHINLSFKCFADTDNLYLANLDGKYAFPLSEITSITTVKKRVRLSSWNKETAFNQGEYKKYKMASDQFGAVHCNSHYIIELSHNNETWGIYIPCYELPVFETLTGKCAK